MKTITEISRSLYKYVSGYNKEESIREYSDETFIDDIIYGLGTSFDQSNAFAQGALKFRKELHAHLTKRINEEDPEWLKQN
mgnify:FL=1